MPTSDLVLYTTPSGEVRIDVVVQAESVWLTQGQMAELFEVQVPAISKHLKNIFDSSELDPGAVVSEMERTAADGKRYSTRHYHLDAIIAVGYRVNSRAATQFRVWATATLRGLRGVAPVSDKPNPGQTFLFGPPPPKPPPLPRWWRLRILDLPATESGLARLTELAAQVLARDWRFLAALEEHLDLDHEEAQEGPIARFIALEQDSLDLLLGLRGGHVEAVEIEEELAGLQQHEEERLTLRDAILEALSDEVRGAVLHYERHHPVHPLTVERRAAEIELETADAAGELVDLVFDPDGSFHFRTGEEGGASIMAGIDLDELEAEAGLIGPGMVSELVRSMELEHREEQESRSLPKQARLSTLLKGLPIQWLDAVGLHLGLPTDGLRKEREHTIAAQLTQPETLLNLLAELERDELELLSDVLDDDGVSPVGLYRSRCWFDQDEDGFFWVDRPPVSVPGLLRLRGFLFVGTWQFGDRQQRAFMIPREMRELLASLLEARLA